jgi:hypothetical protein
MEILLTSLISTISSVSLLAALAFLLKGLIIERLKNSVKHEFDKKLADYQKEIDKENKRYESQIETLNRVFSEFSQANITNNTKYKEKQLAAIELLWTSLVTIESMIPGEFILLDNLPDSLKEDFINHTQNQINTSLISTININNYLSGSNFKNTQLFIDDVLWSYFQSYLTIVNIALLKTETLLSKNEYTHWSKHYNKPWLKKFITNKEIDLDNEIGLTIKILADIKDSYIQTARSILNGQQSVDTEKKNALARLSAIQELSAS